MKNIISTLLIATFSCQKGKQVAETFPLQESDSKRWSVYEGRIPLNDNTHLYLEVSILPSDVLGEGSFHLTESLQEEQGSRIVSELKGSYSIIYGEGPEELIVQLHNSAHPQGFKRTYLSRGGGKSNSEMKALKEESFRHTDLTLKIRGNNKLLVLDQKLKPITNEIEYNLTKRTSKVFTVEGYFRHNGDTADFFEINTREKWPISKLGEYARACNEYHRLVEKKHEVTYMKATAYSINQLNENGDEMEVLVFKKILQMTSTLELNPQ